MLVNSPALLLGSFQWQTTFINVVLNTTTPFLESDPNRVAICCYPVIGQTYTVGPTSMINQTNGIIVTQQGFTLPFRYQDYGPFINQQWFACGVTGSFAALVSILSYTPRVN